MFWREKMSIVIIGGGPAGRTAAMEAAQIGKEVILIEKKKIGGTCLHEGCMIVSGLNDVAKYLEDSKKYVEMGIIPTIQPIDYPKVVKGIKDITGKIQKVLEHETKETGAEIVTGEAKLVNGNVEVNKEEFSYDKLIIATGSKPSIPPIPGAENAYSYKDVLNFKDIPENVIIIGSGVIASEFAGIFSSFGAKVSVLCRGKFLSRLDPEIKNYIIQNILQKVQILENIAVNEVNGEGVSTSQGEMEGVVFLATGLEPYSEIAKGIVEIGTRKQIRVNEQMKTSDPDIYAGGDVVGTIGNTPAARMEGTVAARNACGIATTMDYRLIPKAINLYYDISTLESETILSAKNDQKKTDTHEIRIRGSAGPGSFWRVLDGNTGFTKMLVDMENGDIKSVSSISPSSRTSIPYLAKMIKDGYKTADFDDFIETHPSTDAMYKLLHFLARFG